MIRKMKTEDAAAVREICERSLGYSAETAQIEKMIARLSDDDHYFLTVFVDEKSSTVQGFLQAQRYDILYSGSGWNVISLAVAPDVQGRGIGKALMQALETHAAERGDAFVRLNSRSERSGAHAFYAHLGYDCDKTQKRFIKYF